MGRVLIALAAGLFLSTTAFAAPAGVSVQVTLENIRHRDGIVLAELRDAQTWRKGKRLQGVETPMPTAGPVTFTFANVAPGRYAIRLFQDRNKDMELQTNGFGLPSEPWGMSQNPSLLRGPPSFEAAAFAVDNGDVSLRIRLR